MRWWFLLLRIAVSGAFIWAGAVKALDPAKFADAIDGYQLVPYAVAVAVALYLPWLEIICGLALITNRLASGGMALLSCLLLVFIAAILSAWWRGLSIDCGCFSGSNDKGHYLWPIMRDLALLVALTILALSSQRARNYAPVASA